MKFAVVYEPDEGGWHAHIPEVQGCRTWGRTLKAARRNLREALSVSLDTLPAAEADRTAEEAEFVEDIRLPGDAKALLARYETARHDADERAARAQEALHDAAVALTKTVGLSLRDAGELVGLSQERVRQVLDHS